MDGTTQKSFCAIAGQHSRAGRPRLAGPQQLVEGAPSLAWWRRASWRGPTNTTCPALVGQDKNVGAPIVGRNGSRAAEIAGFPGYRAFATKFGGRRMPSVLAYLGLGCAPDSFFSSKHQETENCGRGSAAAAADGKRRKILEDFQLAARFELHSRGARDNSPQLQRGDFPWQASPASFLWGAREQFWR